MQGIPQYEDYRLLAWFAGLPDDTRRREAMLCVARKLTGDVEGTSALLWLRDDAKDQLHLDHFEPFSSAAGLERISLACSSMEEIDIQKAIESCQKVNEWIRHSDDREYRLLFLVKAVVANCYLEIITKKPLPPAKRELFESFAEVIAARITRHRNSRRLAVHKSLTNQADQSEMEHDGIELWLKSAATVAQQATSARMALVFRLAPDLSLRPVSLAGSEHEEITPNCVANSESLIKLVFDQKLRKRILNHADEREREREFGTANFDQELAQALASQMGKPLRSWIAAAVTCDEEPVAVIVVANKLDYLPEAFSATDFDIVESICKVLSYSLAQAQTKLALRKISEFVFKYNANPSESDNQLRELLETVRSYVPGIVAGAVSLRLFENDAAAETWSLGVIDQALSPIVERRLNRPINAVATGRPSQTLSLAEPAGTKVYVYEERMPFVVDRTAVLHLFSLRNRLAKFELEVLSYLCADLGQLVRSERTARSEAEKFLQIRHALRSGLQGVRHIDNAWEVYELIARRGMTPSDFRVAMLRKSLEWTRLFAKRCGVLLEESRFLLDRLYADQLRLGGSSLHTLLHETVRGLAPDATDREIEVDVQAVSSSRDMLVTIDRLLMEIAIFNLIDKAIKYSHRHKRVNVRYSLFPTKWRLSVTDTGVFIRESDRNAIFEPLVRRPTGQAQSTRPGTGLGLAVTKQIIVAHRGTIAVESLPLNRDRPEDGAETTFTIEVPR